MAKCRFLSGAMLKALACLFMLIDHAGMLLFPDAEWMRCVGRLAFPLFAFFIAEGCRYTKNRLKHLAQILLLGIVCEAVYILADGGYYGNILLTFSLSIVLIYLWQECQKHLFDRKPIAFLWGGLFLTATVCIALFVDAVGVDYGFAGVMTAVLVSFAHDRFESAPPALKRWYSLPVRLALLTAALLWVTWDNALPARQAWCLLAVLLLLLYNGTAGKRRFKYGFYVFYPLHLALLQLIAWVV